MQLPEYTTVEELPTWAQLALRYIQTFEEWATVRREAKHNKTAVVQHELTSAERCGWYLKFMRDVPHAIEKVQSDKLKLGGTVGTLLLILNEVETQLEFIRAVQLEDEETARDTVVDE